MAPAGRFESRASSRDSYPLSALFLLVAVAGILSAFMGPAARAVSTGNLGTGELIGAIWLGSMAFAIIGAAIGSYHIRWVRGLLMGLAVGSVVGALVTPLALATRDDAIGVALLSATSIALLVVTGTLLRFRERNRRRS